MIWGGMTGRILLDNVQSKGVTSVFDPLRGGFRSRKRGFWMTPPASLSAADPKYLVDQIFPAHEVHIIAGASGSGKTTLIFQLLDDLIDGKLIFGEHSHPVDVAYVAIDRSEAAIQRTLERVNPRHKVLAMSVISDKIDTNLDVIINKVLSRQSRTKLVVLDGIAKLVPKCDLKDYGKVSDFLMQCTRLCEARKLTILGAGHNAKVKRGEEYQNPRERVLGSAAWGGFSETVIDITAPNPDDPDDPSRTIAILTHNSRPKKLAYTFNDDGRLVPVEDYNEYLELDIWLVSLGRGVEFDTRALHQVATQKQIPERSMWRWVADCIEKSKLEKIKRGAYRRPQQQ